MKSTFPKVFSSQQDFNVNLDLRIADFGFAERITKNNHEESKEKKVNNDIVYGTPSYIPPEALKG